jgi:hypothetical protein
LLNLNFNHSFNQTPIFSNQPQLKVLFIKQFFSNHNHNRYRNTKHTLNGPSQEASYLPQSKPLQLLLARAFIMITESSHIDKNM